MTLQLMPFGLLAQADSQVGQGSHHPYCLSGLHCAQETGDYVMQGLLGHSEHCDHMC